MNHALHPNVIHALATRMGLVSANPHVQKTLVEALLPSRMGAFIESLQEELTKEEQKEASAYFTARDPEGFLAFIVARIPDFDRRFALALSKP